MSSSSSSSSSLSSSSSASSASSASSDGTPAPSPSPTASTTAFDADVRELCLALHDISAVSLGRFTLKSGIISPIYIDLRVIVSFPHLLKLVSRVIHSIIVRERIKFDVVCGVPYTALPFASVLSAEHSYPMVMKRKEGAKAYGLKKAVEGVFNQNDNCLMIEDLVTSGASVCETAEPLRDAGLIVNDVIVLIDREQGARDTLAKNKMRLFPVTTVTNLLSILLEAHKIKAETRDEVLTFIRQSQPGTMYPASPTRQPQPSPALPWQKRDKHWMGQTFEERASYTKNEAGRELFQLMSRKKTNLCLSADVTTKDELVALADLVGPSICILKTHMDVISDWDASLIDTLVALSKKHDFLLFEDRKFCDIGNTVSLQYAKGVFKIAEWANIINCYLTPGTSVINCLRQVAKKKAGLLLIAEMSTDGNLCNGTYTELNVKLASEYQDFVMGFICQRGLSTDGSFVHLTPGVQMQKGGDGKGQQYNSPANLIARGSDVLIVGRGVIAAEDPRATAEEFRRSGWQAYEERVRELNTAFEPL